MHPAIETRYDQKRGCGYRKVGGLYLMQGAGPTMECGRLPIPLHTCPACGGGIKQARGWTWIEGDALIEDLPACQTPETDCNHCLVSRLVGRGPGISEDLAGVGRCGLLWVGEKFYPTPGAFNREADKLGISRRINSIPRGFKVGETVVMLAHPIAVGPSGPDEGKGTPGVFRILRPSHIEVVVSGGESKEEIDDYLARGLTPVRVFHSFDQPALDDAEGEEET